MAFALGFSLTCNAAPWDEVPSLSEKLQPDLRLMRQNILPVRDVGRGCLPALSSPPYGWSSCQPITTC